MDDRRKKLIGLTLGDPWSEKSRSGVNKAIFSRLNNRLDLLEAVDCSITGLYKYICALKSFHADKQKWRRYYHQNPYAFEKRSIICSNKIKKYSGSYDAIYQDGAMFMPMNIEGFYVTNHDANVVLTSQGGEYSVGAHYALDKTLYEETYKQEKKVYERADHIFVRSNWVKASMINDFSIDESKITINPSGVHLAVPENIEKKYNARNILFVGKDLPIKGYDILIAAFKQMLNKQPDLVLHIVGTSHGWNLDDRNIKYYGFLGSDKSEILYKLYASADLLILPSRYDAFPKVLIEAGAFKVPCIATNVCGIPEIVEDTISGYLVPPEDVESIVEKSFEILSNHELSERMGNAGFKKYKERFNWDAHVDQIVRVINSS